MADAILPFSHNMPDLVVFEGAEIKENCLLLCSPRLFSVET